MVSFIGKELTQEDTLLHNVMSKLKWKANYKIINLMHQHTNNSSTNLALIDNNEPPPMLYNKLENPLMQLWLKDTSRYTTGLIIISE